MHHHSIPWLPGKIGLHPTCMRLHPIHNSSAEKSLCIKFFIVSNPPYLGASRQDKSQKEDIATAFSGQVYSKKIDYISIWFLKGARYIRDSNSKLAFVSTNSVVQGDHVSLIFPTLFAENVEIGFAHTSFKWENNAKRKAGVTVVIVSLRPISADSKFIFHEGVMIEATNINPYLVDGKNVFVSARPTPFSSQLPRMLFGSKPVDAGGLRLSESQAGDLMGAYPNTASWVKLFLGADEYLKGERKYCLWVPDEDFEKALQIPEIRARFELVKGIRLDSSKAATVKLANFPNRFGESRFKETDSIIVPSVTSERREYVPMGYLDSGTVVSNRGYVIYDAELWVFALITSKMHMAWLKAVCGRLETRLSYTNTIVYNTFPVPELSDEDKEALTVVALRVLDVREYHAGATLAELYDPDKMPWNLVEAHKMVDDLVDRLYGKKIFETDEERLSLLFEMYEQQIEAEKLELAAKKPARRRSK